MDYLSSKVALGVASLLLIASAGGIFNAVKKHNIAVELQEMVDSFSEVLWKLNESGEGTTMDFARGEAPLDGELSANQWTMTLYNGLVVLEYKGTKASASLPVVTFGSGAYLTVGTAFSVEKTRGGLRVADHAQP